MKMPKIFHCFKYQDKHERPVEKKYQLKLAGESFSHASKVVAPPSLSKSSTVLDQTLDGSDGQEGAV